MLNPNIQTLLDKLNVIAERFYALLEVDTAQLAVPTSLEGTEFDFFYPFRNRSTEADCQVYDYFRYDGKRIVRQTAYLKGMGQAAGRTFAFLIQNAALHPRIADYILQNSPQPLETIADIKNAVLQLFGKKGLQTFSRALRIHRLFLASIVLKSRLNDTTDGWEFLAERIARPDFEAYLQFVVQVRIAYYLHNFIVAQANEPARCPFPHDLLAETPSLLPLVLDIHGETPLHQTILDTLDEFELSPNRARTQWAFMEALSSGAFLLEDSFYDLYSHVSPLQKFMVYDPTGAVCYRIGLKGEVLAHIYDADPLKINQSLLPSKSRIRIINKDGQTFLFPMLGHCPELIWGGLAVQADFQVQAQDKERKQAFEAQWTDGTRRQRLKTRGKNIRGES